MRKIMGDDMQMSIHIPTDNDGYVLLKCPQCGTFFKSTPSDIEDEGVLKLYCPICGLSSSNYMTDDVIDLALAMTKNTEMNMVYDELQKMESQLSEGCVTFKAGRRPKHEPENPICSGIEALEIASFSCCNRAAKIKPILKMTGCYCPFCGVKNYEIK